MTVADVTKNVQFTVDQSGQITAVVLTPELWKRIIEALENAEDRELVEILRSRLVGGPVSSGTLRWQDVADEWA